MSKSAAAKTSPGQAPSPIEICMEEWRGLNETLFRDGAIALGRLEHCRSPMDFAQVQQDCFLAWLTASMDAGMRVAGAAANAVAPRAALEEVFHLPD